MWENVIVINSHTVPSGGSKRNACVLQDSRVLSDIADFSYLPKSVRVGAFGVTFNGIPSLVILHYEKIGLFPSEIFQGVFIKHLSQVLLSKTESRMSLPHRSVVGRYWDN